MLSCWHGVFFVLNKKKFDIYKTFDVFNSESINSFKAKMLKIVFVEAENIFLNKASCIIADITNENNPYLTILNNRKIFNLLNNYITRQNKIKNHENH